MNTVKHLNSSNLQRLPKRRFRFWIKSSIPAVLLSSLLGTYLDLVLVGKGLYSFPIRLFPDILSINLLFSLLGLPGLTILFLFFMEMPGKWGRVGIIVCLSLVMSVLERMAEEFGLFVHAHAWSHLYTFFGYCLFLHAVFRFHVWITSGQKR